MRSSQNGHNQNGRGTNYFLLFAGILGAVLAVMFYRSFEPNQILFANDGPMGAMAAACNRLPGRFFGTWRNIMWLGVEAPSAAPTLSILLQTIFSPVMYLKIYGPFTLFFTGFSAWLLFRQLGFKPMVCVAGGVAAGLNMHFFSTACWGLGNWNLAMGMTFLALAALTSKSITQTWVKAVLAGLAVGMGLMEGYDVGVMMSISVGIFVVFQAFNEEGVGFGRKALSAVWVEAVVVLFAAFIAAHSISTLVQTQVEGVVSAKQDEKTKEKRWDPDTQWSLPKTETLRLVTPGLFGYRLLQYITDTNKASAYWGLTGHDPRIDEMKSDDPAVRADVEGRFTSPLYPDEKAALESGDPQTRAKAAEKVRIRTGMFLRHSGTGEYAGALVAVLALLAVANSLRGRNNSPLSPAENRAVWFWTAGALLSLVVAWGRYAFLYSLLYHVPYFSTIRNPIKFLHLFQLSWLILAGYGLEILARRYLQASVKKSEAAKGATFEKKWAMACAVAMFAAGAGLFVLISQKDRLIMHLVDNGFKVESAPLMAGFCIQEAAWSVAFLGLSAIIVSGILRGGWGGANANWSWFCLIGIIVLDLGRSDLPWIHFYDYQEKYASNDLEDLLIAKKPDLQRVVGRLSPRGPGSSNGKGFGPIYDFWMQNDFPYHDIQTLDFAQMPRMPEMDDAYLRNFQLIGTNVLTADLRPSTQLWRLTGTRYLVLDASALDLLNQHGDPIRHGFHFVNDNGLPLRLRPRPKSDADGIEDAGDMTVVKDPKGSAALIELDGVLPRAKLYPHWETPANGPAMLATLASTNFDLMGTVLLWTNPPVPVAAMADAGKDAGTVETTDYQPRYVKLHAQAKTPSVLLFNDRYSPSWKAWVDQKPAPLLRCNYIMRGVYLEPGEHTVEFRFQPPLSTLYVSLAGWASGLLVAGHVVAGRRRKAV